MVYFTIQNVRYFVEVKGDGVPLVLLHGFTGSHENWISLSQALSSNFQVISIDIVGHGTTESPPDPNRYAMNRVAQDIIEIVEQLGLWAIHLLGYSMGGRLALYIALHYPKLVKSLCLESASPGLKTPQEQLARVEQDEKLAQMIEVEGIKAFVQFWENIPLFQSQQKLSIMQQTQLRQQRLTNSALGLANSLRGMGAGRQPSLWEQLSTLQMPTQLIVGELDTKFVRINQEMSALILQNEFTIVPNAGHAIHLEQSEAFEKIVRGWLQGT